MIKHKAFKIANEMREYKPNSSITAFKLDDEWVVSLDGVLYNEQTWLRLKQELDHYRSGDAFRNWLSYHKEISNDSSKILEN